MKKQISDEDNSLVITVRMLLLIIFLFLSVIVLLLIIQFYGVASPVLTRKQLDHNSVIQTGRLSVKPRHATLEEIWKAPDTSGWSKAPHLNVIRYGRELVANTALYYGPKGSVAAITNGMNCQNCHLNAGTVAFGNNFFWTAASYPKYSARSNHFESLHERINDCFERSLNGIPISAKSKEMKAITAYISWMGKDANKERKPYGAGLAKLPFLERAASPEKGEVLYISKCRSCHQENGSGILARDKRSYIYPPLWGRHSFNTGAGEYRMSNLAAFIKSNMPLGASYDRPQLSNGEAWDIAAYIESMKRPIKNVSADYPVINKKPFDDPLGPYADHFTPLQHKYGPFSPIVAASQSSDKK